MNEQAKKILNTVWCENAPESRASPESYGIERSQGWGIDYEQNKYPERKVWNQLLREIQGALRDKMKEGILSWESDLNYPQYAFVKHAGRIYVSTTAVAAGGGGPGVDDAWRRY